MSTNKKKPQLPIGRFLESMCRGGKRVILVVIHFRCIDQDQISLSDVVFRGDQVKNLMQASGDYMLNVVASNKENRPYY